MIDEEEMKQSCKSVTNFNPNDLPDNFTFAFFGRRGSGKTIALKNIVRDIRKRFTDVYLFSETAHYQEDEYNFVPKSNKFEGMKMEVVEKIFQEQQQKILEKGKKSKKIPTPLLIFDDCINDKLVRTSPIFSKIFVSGRHMKISCIVLSQSMGGKAGLPLVARSNLDACLCFYLHAEYDRELLVSQYLSIKNKKHGGEFFKNVTTEDYTSLVMLLRKVHGRDYNDYCYKYVAKLKVPNFMIGKDYSNQYKGNPTESQGMILSHGGAKKNPFGIHLPIQQQDEFGDIEEFVPDQF
jgi:Cdc6-like AAA superfamily ATPase